MERLFMMAAIMRFLLGARVFAYAVAFIMFFVVSASCSVCLASSDDVSPIHKYLGKTIEVRRLNPDCLSKICLFGLFVDQEFVLAFNSGRNSRISYTNGTGELFDKRSVFIFVNYKYTKSFGDVQIYVYFPVQGGTYEGECAPLNGFFELLPRKSYSLKAGFVVSRNSWGCGSALFRHQEQIIEPRGKL